MFARLRRTAAVLAIIVAVYALYSVAVVPWVEPAHKTGKNSRPTPSIASKSSKYSHLFAAGSWELERPMMIDTDQGTLIFAGYEFLSKSQIKLSKCTLIAQLEEAESGNATSNRGPGRPIIIRAMQGATIEFDRAIDFLHGEFGDLKGGQLDGEVTIVSPPSTPDSDDALQLETKNIQIDRQKIWTPHEVRFRYGPNRGTGRILTIHLGKLQKAKPKQPALGIGGIRSLELVHLDRMELMLNDDGLFGRSPGSVATAATKAQPNATPVEVTSRGPLRLDFLRQFMSLEDQVHLSRKHAAGPSDSMNCEQLQIHFATVESPASTKTTTTKSATAAAGAESRNRKLTPTRVVAIGHPVVIRAATAGVGARAERIEYDCILQRVWLQDRDKVLLNDHQREIEAKELRYKIAAGNRLGDLWAQGPGIVRGEFGKEMTRFDVTWQEEVQLQRVANEPVLSFTSRAKISVAGFGLFTGDTLHLYFQERPRAGTADRVDIVPDRLHAVGNVEVDTESCHATLHEAKLWFKQPDKLRAVSPAAFPPRQSSDATTGVAGNGPRSTRSKFDLRARTVEAVVRMGDKPIADLVIVRGGIELRELTAGNLPPVVIRGEHFELQDGASARPKAALLGNPAEITARGAFASGPKMHLHPADNFLEIVGAGQLRLPTGGRMDPSIKNGPPTGIVWGRQMQFDGQLARFEHEVIVRGSETGKSGDLTTFVGMGDLVHAELTQRIDFQKLNMHGPIELVEAAFGGWGFLQAEMFDAQGIRKSFQQMQVLGLTVNQLTGDIQGRGPGWVRGVHRGGEQLVHVNVPAPSATATPANQLAFLRVDFERELAGNLREQRLEFLNGTKTLYGPVNAWDEALDQTQSHIPPGAVVLTCDRLGVSQGGDQGVDSVELEAVGNAHIQGETFSATGARVSYVRMKDQLILEGDGRNYARLQYQTKSDAKPADLSASKIMYGPKTQQLQVVGLRQTEIYDLGQFGRTKPAPKPR